MAQLQKFKKNHVKKERVGEPGEAMMVNVVGDVVITYIKGNRNVNVLGNTNEKGLRLKYL